MSIQSYVQKQQIDKAKNETMGILDSILAESVEQSETQGTQTEWYIVKVNGNREDTAVQLIKQYAADMGLSYKFRDVINPTQTVEEVVDGKVTQKQERILPGNILIQVEGIDDEVISVLNATPMVYYVFKTGDEYIPMNADEINNIFKRMENTVKQVAFKIGDRVMITNEQLNGFEGHVVRFEEGGSRVQVATNFFGQDTNVTLPVNEVKALN